MVGSAPQRESTDAIMEDVVVFPWLPATAMPNLSLISSASISALGMRGILAAAAAIISELSFLMADEYTTTSLPLMFSEL